MRLSGSTEKDILRRIEPRRKRVRAAPVRVGILHQPSVGGPYLTLRGARLKAKDLVGFLRVHWTRIGRATLPRVLTRVEVFTPAGKPAVEIRFEQR